MIPKATGQTTIERADSKLWQGLLSFLLLSFIHGHAGHESVYLGNQITQVPMSSTLASGLCGHIDPFCLLILLLSAGRVFFYYLTPVISYKSRQLCSAHIISQCVDIIVW